MLSEISQTQKDKQCMISHIDGIKKNQIQRTREEWWEVREMGKYWSKGTNFQL